MEIDGDRRTGDIIAEAYCRGYFSKLQPLAYDIPSSIFLRRLGVGPKGPYLLQNVPLFHRLWTKPGRNDSCIAQHPWIIRFRDVGTSFDSVISFRLNGQLATGRDLTVSQDAIIGASL